jgi:glycosyltransferase involved in cell wall biosynthesis
MKLIIQIPCLNEENRLPITWRDLPKTVPGVDALEILVIDDGSTDRTAAVARELGTHLLQMDRHVGLARAFQAGIREALRLGADIVVNTDADHQYPGADIGRLIQPILEKRAEIVIGDRGVARVPFFSPQKRLLQRIGSRVVQAAAGIPIPDAASGFRAYSRKAALQLKVLSHFSYTLENLIQAGHLGIPVIFIPIKTNPPTGPSRLMRNIPHYVMKSGITIIRTYARYHPMRVFIPVGGTIFMIGLLMAFPWLRSLLWGTPQGPAAEISFSASLGSIMMALGIFVMTGLTACHRKRDNVDTSPSDAA